AGRVDDLQSPLISARAHHRLCCSAAALDRHAPQRSARSRGAGANGNQAFNAGAGGHGGNGGNPGTVCVVGCQGRGSAPAQPVGAAIALRSPP
ncbi:hypothetical protein ACNJQJ_23010, partial [Mycobacterium tuberculosis]